MKITDRHNNGQVWGINNVISNGFEDYYIIAQDNLTGKYRLLSLYDGVILTDEYDSIEEIKQNNGDLNPISHTEIVISD